MLIKCPTEFSGDFKTFFVRFVEPNLPSVERVRQFDSLISEYVESENPAYIVRMVSGMNREDVFANTHHDQILGSDNSPGLWIHATLMGTAPILENACDFFEMVPRHMFRIPKVETLRSAGYHLAHIVSAKDGNTKWQDWSKSELERRFLLNVHPCNWFLAGKAQWQLNGGRADIIDWVKSAYAERFGSLYESFVERTGNICVKPSNMVFAPIYSFSAANTGKKTTARAHGAIDTAPRRPLADKSAELLDTRRPYVRKKLLGQDAKLRITTGGMQILVPHDALWRWVASETNVRNTKSWKKLGRYSWPAPSAKMLNFLDEFKITS